MDKMLHGLIYRYRRHYRGPAVALLVGVATLSHGAGAAGHGDVDPALAAAGWKAFEFSNIRPASFAKSDDGGLDVRSRDGASIIYRMLSAQEMQCRKLKWRWRVEQSVPATDLTEVGKDDRDIAVHLWFPEQEKGGMWKALGRAFSAAAGLPVTGKALTYVFGGKGARLESAVNPHSGLDGVMIMLRPTGTPLGKWFEEEIDFAADYQKAFGTPAPQPAYIAISTDSDDTDTESAGRVARIMFLDQ